MTDKFDTHDLEAVFARMRDAEDPAMSDDLMDRIMADARAVQAGHPSPQPLSVRDRVLNVLGGWGSASGLAAATVAGLWIGIVQPPVLTDFWGSSIELPVLENDLLSALEG